MSSMEKNNFDIGKMISAYINFKLDKDKPIYFGVVFFKSKYADPEENGQQMVNYRKPFRKSKEARDYARGIIKEMKKNLGDKFEYLIVSPHIIQCQNFETAMQMRDGDYNNMKIMQVDDNMTDITDDFKDYKRGSLI